MPAVHAKFAVVVISLGACACTLLAFRQSRLQVASELTQTQLRINAADERLWLLRARIGAEVAPARIEEMATELGDLRPLAEDPILPDASGDGEGKTTPVPAGKTTPKASSSASVKPATKSKSGRSTKER